MGKVTFAHGQLGLLMQALESSFPGTRLDRSDGLKLLLDDGWIHARSSNTEPILRVAAEARSAARAEALYRQAMALLTA
jgi:phosphomannomutase